MFISVDEITVESLNAGYVDARQGEALKFKRLQIDFFETVEFEQTGLQFLQFIVSDSDRHGRWTQYRSYASEFSLFEDECMANSPVF